jgi:hypothetical protein
VTRLGVGRQRNFCTVHGMEKRFPSRLRRPYFSGVRPTSSFKDNKFILLEVERPEPETDQLPVFSTEVKKRGTVNLLLLGALVAYRGFYRVFRIYGY